MRNNKKIKVFYRRRKKQRLEKNKYNTNQIDMTTQNHLYRNHKCHRYIFHNIETSSTKSNKDKRQTSLTMNNNSYSNSLQLWWQTYCTAINYFQYQQQLWRSQLREPNHRTLSPKLTEQDLLEKYAKEYETSSSEDENEDKEMARHDYHYHNNSDNTEEEAIDEEYLKFLEITYKHREKLKLRREKEL